ncbi:MAG: hypothetical protein KA007_02620 [Candidatus Pacebacteria bacterium]|nr:hypothetical protein [Candidatus Paceibacterota bacterium]
MKKSIVSALMVLFVLFAQGQTNVQAFKQQFIVEKSAQYLFKTPGIKTSNSLSWDEFKPDIELEMFQSQVATIFTGLSSKSIPAEQLVGHLLNSHQKGILSNSGNFFLVKKDFDFITVYVFKDVKSNMWVIRSVTEPLAKSGMRYFTLS